MDALKIAAVLLGVAAGAAVPACNSVFQCADASACVLDGVSGFCEADGFCSFPDGDCPSGHRYGDFAGNDLSGVCVPTTDGTGSTSTSTSDGETTLVLDSAEVETSATPSDSSSSTGDMVEPPECPAPPACTRYVAPLGVDDPLNGSKENPFETIQFAVDNAVPGDVVCVREGEYDLHVDFRTSGSEGAPIVLRSHPGETARLTGGMNIQLGWGVSVGWIVLEDLDISQSGGTDPEVGNQCIYFHSAHDIVLRNNYIHDCNGGGLVGLARDVLIDGNRISRCALDVVDQDYYGGGISMSGTHIVVQNNRIERNASRGVILVADPWNPDPIENPNHPEDASYNDAAGWVVTNNVFAFNQDGPALRVQQAGSTGAIIQNNIFVENNEDGVVYVGNGIEFADSGGGHIVRNNLFFGTEPPITDTGRAHVESDSVLEDPLFIDPGGTDFRVAPGSPAIDRGIADAAPDHDTECAVRPQGEAVDLGVYEAAPQ